MKKKKKKQKIVGWDLYRDGVSQSFIENFLTCKQQTYLKYIRNWTRDVHSPAAEFGICFHWLLKKIYTAKKPLPVKTLILQYKKEWLKYKKMVSQKQHDSQEIVYGMCERVLPEYLKRWNGDFGGKYEFGSDVVQPKKWVSLETRYEVPYTYSDGRKTLLIVVFDGIFYDKKKGLWLFETKTKSRVDEETLQDMFIDDIQVMLSLLAIKRYYKVKPKGGLYNVIRRPGQKMLKEDSLKSFLTRIKKDVSNPKRYDHYFMRWEIAIDWSEVMDWKRTFLDPVMRDIRNWVEGEAPHYHNPLTLTGQYGRSDYYDAILKKDFRYLTQRKFYSKKSKE